MINNFPIMEITEPFTVSRSAVLRHLVTTPSVIWPAWIAMSGGLILTGIGCFGDVRLIVVGLMIWVAVVPSIVALIYFYHSLSPALVPNLLPHTLERYPAGYILRIWRVNEPADTAPDERSWTESATIRLFDSNIVKKKKSFEYEMLFFKDSGLNILYVPRYWNENTKKYQPKILLHHGDGGARLWARLRADCQ